MVSGQTGLYGWSRERERHGWMGGLEEWVDGWTRGMGGLLVIIHDSIYG